MFIRSLQKTKSGSKGEQNTSVYIATRLCYGKVRCEEVVKESYLLFDIDDPLINLLQ